VLADRIERATTVLARLRGLLGRDHLAEGSALVIEPCTSIHTFFMRFAIDALFLDRDGRVVRAIGSMRPFRMSRVYPSAALVVELPAGTLARSGVRQGDKVSFVEESPGDYASRRTPGAAI
jgi:uncharacterized membrane protein (UPF0127 family)